MKPKKKKAKKPQKIIWAVFTQLSGELSAIIFPTKSEAMEWIKDRGENFPKYKPYKYILGQD